MHEPVTVRYSTKKKGVGRLVYGEIKQIDRATAVGFLLPRHYSGRSPSVSVAFGWYFEGELKAVCTFGKPASPTLCFGVCGKEWSANVYELNRLCRTEDLDRPLSQFVGKCLRELKSRNWIVVSYSDTGMHHNGYIYQACNFMYTGKTPGRTDRWAGEGKHQRHYDKDAVQVFRIVRTEKHRYIYFCTASRALRRKWGESLNYPVLPYPKDENKNYVLGEYYRPQIIDLRGENG